MAILCIDSVYEGIAQSLHPALVAFQTWMGGDIVNPLATLVAAFAGSWFAYKLQARHAARETVRQNTAAGNRALLTLLQQANTLKLYQIDRIEPHRNSPGRCIEIRPTLPYQEDAWTFDIKALDFLLLSRAEATILMDLVMEETRYKEAIKTINARSLLHHEVIQPKLYAANIEEHTLCTAGQIRRALGELDEARIRRITDAVIKHVDRTLVSLMTAKTRLRAILKKAYPKENFVDFELLTDPPKSLFQEQSEDEDTGSRPQ